MTAWYPFYWSDYSGKTMHLTMQQHGAYMLLLRYYYTIGRAIPHKQRYSIARALLEQEQSDVDFILLEFFEREGDFWVNHRAEDIISETKEKSEKRKLSGSKGGKAKAERAASNHNKPSNATDLPEQKDSNTLLTTAIATATESVTSVTDYPLPLTDSTELAMADPGGAITFEEFWNAYPKPSGRAAAKTEYLKTLAQGNVNHATIISGCRKYADFYQNGGVEYRYIPNPAKWLESEGWRHDYRLPDKASQPGASYGDKLFAAAALTRPHDSD